MLSFRKCFTLRKYNRFAHTEPLKKNDIFLFGTNNFAWEGSSDRQFIEPVCFGTDAIKFIDSGFSHFIGLTSEDVAFGWGRNETGQLGVSIGQYKVVSTPIKISPLSNVRISQLALGRSHSLALIDSGSVISFGSNEFGQIGNGTFGEQQVEAPSIVPALAGKGIVKIATGFDHCIALNHHGQVYNWGFGIGGQLNPEFENIHTPTLVEGLGDIVDIACGQDHSLALNSQGILWAWGCSDFIYQEEMFQHIPPTPVEIDKRVIKASGGELHNLALAEDGTCYTWGIYLKGNLGYEDDTQNTIQPKPVDYFVKNNIRIKQISTGASHNLALSEEGDLYSWGAGGSGQLGHLDDLDRTIPTKVKYFEGKNIRFIKASFEGSMIVCDVDNK